MDDEATRFREVQIIWIAREREAGATTGNLCRKHVNSTATFYNLKAKFDGIDASNTKKHQADSDATKPDTDFTLTIEDAAQLNVNAGHPRTFRTVQHYCASDHLNCVKPATTLGDKNIVSSRSVARHIAQI